MTIDQYLFARTHEPIADRLAGDLSGLFPERRDELRSVALRALIGAVVEWHWETDQVTFEELQMTFEELAGARVRDSLARHTGGWRVEG